MPAKPDHELFEQFRHLVDQPALRIRRATSADPLANRGRKMTTYQVVQVGESGNVAADDVQLPLGNSWYSASDLNLAMGFAIKAIGLYQLPKPSEEGERPRTDCGCGYDIVYTDEGWQHDAAPWFWGDDHDPDPDSEAEAAAEAWDEAHAED